MLKKNIVKLHYYFLPLHRLKRSGAKIGKNIFWGDSVYVELENAKLLTVEDGVVVSAHCKFILHDSSLNNTTGFDMLFGKINLKKGCYLGANTLLLPGAEVGANTIVGANSLVKGKLKSNSVYLGQPAKYFCALSSLEAKWKRKKAAKESMIYFSKQIPFSKNKK